MTYLKYGSYPQTVVTNNRLIRNLDDITDVDSNGYYSYDDNEYAKLVAEPFGDSYYNFSDEKTIVENGNTYYFKVEPITWRVLSENDGTYRLLSENIIDVQEFDETINNYKDSEIREWLNDDFYNKAFTDKSRIQSTLVDNSVESTMQCTNEYICDDTNDNIFLLSCSDVLNEDYGFSGYEAISGGNRKTVVSDYALARGCFKLLTEEDPYGFGWWWLRSSFRSGDEFISTIWDTGNICFDFVYSSYEGVRPSLKISK